MHDQLFGIGDAILRQLVEILGKHLSIDERIIVLGVVVAVEPDGDVLRIGDPVAGELLAGNLRYIDRHLGLRTRNGDQDERQS